MVPVGILTTVYRPLQKETPRSRGDQPGRHTPTAAIPDLRNRFAPPFVFLVTGLPEDFRDQLVEEGVWFVDSHLAVLFVERVSRSPTTT
jgi:hypothetical protein